MSFLIQGGLYDDRMLRCFCLSYKAKPKRLSKQQRSRNKHAIRSILSVRNLRETVTPLCWAAFFAVPQPKLAITQCFGVLSRMLWKNGAGLIGSKHKGAEHIVDFVYRSADQSGQGGKRVKVRTFSLASYHCLVFFDVRYRCVYSLCPGKLR